MIGWHHWLNGHEFEQTLGESEGQGSLACWVHEVAKSQTRVSNWTTTTTKDQDMDNFGGSFSATTDSWLQSQGIGSYQDELCWVWIDSSGASMPLCPPRPQPPLTQGYCETPQPRTVPHVVFEASSFQELLFQVLYGPDMDKNSVSANWSAVLTSSFIGPSHGGCLFINSGAPSVQIPP